MALYFFHLRDGEEFIRDDEGSELPDIESARKEARESARDFIAQRVQAKQIVGGQVIEITDSTGTVLESLNVRDVLN